MNIKMLLYSFIFRRSLCCEKDTRTNKLQYEKGEE